MKNAYICSFITSLKSVYIHSWEKCGKEHIKLLVCHDGLMLFLFYCVICYLLFYCFIWSVVYKATYISMVLINKSMKLDAGVVCQVPSFWAFDAHSHVVRQTFFSFYRWAHQGQCTMAASVARHHVNERHSQAQCSQSYHTPQRSHWSEVQDTGCRQLRWVFAPGGKGNKILGLKRWKNF